MKKGKRPRVLLVDDYPQILEQSEKLLKNDCEIVGTACNGGEALHLCLTLKPDIILLDISMPVFSGFEVASRLKELGCKAKIIFVTVQHDQDYVDTAMSLGASGYVLKGRIGIDLLVAIDAVLNDCTFTSPITAPVVA